MELKDTVDMMLSSDYRERFRAEYLQTKIRKDKLDRVIREAGKLDFKLDCTINTLRKQRNIMKQYLGILRARAETEGIDLDDDL